MQYVQLKIKGLIALCLATTVIACNSNQSSDKIADTTATPAVTATPDTVQTTVHDTVTVTQPSAAQESAPSQPAASTPATTTVNKTNKTVIKKKVRVIVESAPVVKHPRFTPDRTGVYEYAEVSPMYPGGQAGIERYINNHIEYPQAALDNNKEGRVGVSFVINENGQVSNAHVNGKGLGQGLDAEAVRVVSSMPNWKPGTVKGRPVKTRVTLPIIFKIEE